jgi:hypothetical protein
VWWSEFFNRKERKERKDHEEQDLNREIHANGREENKD